MGNSSLLPPYLKRACIEELPPWLYLKGISTGCYPEAPGTLLGDQANTVSRQEPRTLGAFLS